MSDLTNTPEKRTPAYGRAAERYTAERELGRRVVEILRTRAHRIDAPESDALHDEAAAIVGVLALGAARDLGLLEKEPRS